MRSTILLVVLAAACTGEPVEGADATSSSETTGTSSTTAPMTTMPMTTSTTAETTETGETSTSDASADESSSSGEPPSSCDFEAAVDATIADATDPIDCGQLTAADPVAAWDEGRTCARSAALSQQAFELSWQIDDGTVRDVAITSMGASMPILQLTDDAAVGTSSISLVMCTGTYTPMDCEVAVGEPCLGCLEPSIATELCD